MENRERGGGSKLMVGLSANPSAWVLYLWAAGIGTGLLALLMLWWWRSGRRWLGFVCAALAPVVVACWVGYWVTSSDRRHIDALTDRLIPYTNPTPGADIDTYGINEKLYCPDEGIQATWIDRVELSAASGVDARGLFTGMELDAMEQIAQRLQADGWSITRTAQADEDGNLDQMTLLISRDGDYGVISMIPYGRIVMDTFTGACQAELLIFGVPASSVLSDFRTADGGS